MRSIQDLSWVGMLKLYSGAPTTITSAARNWVTSASEMAFSRFCTSVCSAPAGARKPRESADRWLGVSTARSRYYTVVPGWLLTHWATVSRSEEHTSELH